MLLGIEVLLAGPAMTGSTAPPSTLPTIRPEPVRGPLTALKAELVVEGLNSPTDVLQLPGSDLFLVAEKPGRVVIIEDGRILESPLLDITLWVLDKANEQGLLTITTHPDFVSNGPLYLFFTDRDGDSQLVEVTLSGSEPPQVERGSLRSILEVPQRHKWHQSGSMVFGPDGYLWVSIGDGGGKGDPRQNGQNPATLEGTIIRIDVGGWPYSIPSDNPFFDLRRPGRPEVWAYGLRNPWRISIDPPTGLLYVPDVGQDTTEEINIVALGDGGTNFGWSETEGSSCFEDRECDPGDYTLPVLQYLHGARGCAIVGGQVYRGAAIPELHGHYFYSDFCRGWVRSLVYESGLITDESDWEPDFGRLGNVTSFGTDNEGELYITNLEGQLWKIVPVRDHPDD